MKGLVFADQWLLWVLVPLFAVWVGLWVLRALLARGRAYAQSRMVCNVHWLSDTEAGMAVGAAAFARLQNDALFQATLAAARQELKQANLERPDIAACDAEASALASLQ